MASTASLGSGLGSPATLPLISTSLNLFYAIIEPTIFIPFLRMPSGSKSSANHSQCVRVWWSHFLPYGLTTILTLGTMNLVFGSYALQKLPRETLAWKVCAAGLSASMGHFLFVYKIGQVIEKICDKEVERKGETMEWLAQWLQIHAWRTALSDAPAVALFAWAVFIS